jgi:hypothetical protein
MSFISVSLLFLYYKKYEGHNLHNLRNYVAIGVTSVIITGKYATSGVNYAKNVL